MNLEEKMTSTSKTITIKQLGSSIRKDPRNALYLKSLGLNKINAVRTLPDNKIVRSLIGKVSNLIKIISD